jgi:hypothetical protein
MRFDRNTLGKGNPPDLSGSTAVGTEVDPFHIRRPGRSVILEGTKGELAKSKGGNLHHPDVAILEIRSIAAKGYESAVGRPCRVGKIFSCGYQIRRAGVRINHL